MTAQLLAAGISSSVQDLGRPGYRRFGVSTGGALDRLALQVANLLVGNEPSAAGIEFTYGGIRLRFADARRVAWCGGGFDARINERPLPAGRVGSVNAGDELRFGHPSAGWRGWLAIAGGIDVPSVLGSRATDLRAQFGGVEGRALQDGDQLPLGDSSCTHPGEAPIVAEWGASPGWSSPARQGGEYMLRVIRGSEWHHFTPAAHANFLGEVFTVTPDADRMGMRITGPNLAQSETMDLRSEGVMPGTIQVPAGGQPIILLADCQTIGGYPKLAHVITVDHPLAAQARPGDTVRFQEVSLEEAHLLLRQRERDLARFRIGLSLRA